MLQPGPLRMGLLGRPMATPYRLPVVPSLVGRLPNWPVRQAPELATIITSPSSTDTTHREQQGSLQTLKEFSGIPVGSEGSALENLGATSSTSPSPHKGSTIPSAAILHPHTEELDIILGPSAHQRVTVVLHQDSDNYLDADLFDCTSGSASTPESWTHPSTSSTCLQLINGRQCQHSIPCQDCLHTSNALIVAAAAAQVSKDSTLPTTTLSHLHLLSSSSNSPTGNSNGAASVTSTSSSTSARNSTDTTSTLSTTVDELPTTIPPQAAADLQPGAQEQQQEGGHACDPIKIWALVVLACSYVHQASTSFSIPVMLPMVSSSLNLSDWEGAMLTTGYSYLYALALVPMGMLADKVSNRPMVLGVGVALWSGLTMVASQANSFGELMAARVGLAAAHSTQNVICFGMIPELFPTTKSTAMAFYNCAIYLGRGLMYLVANMQRELLNHQPAAIDAASQQLIQYDAYGNILVPLEKLDLHLAQLVYTIGDLAAIRASSPLYELTAATHGLEDMAWRQVLTNLALPGALLAAALLFTIPETRKPPSSSATSQTAATIDVSASAPKSNANSKPSNGLQAMWHRMQNMLTGGKQPSNTTSSQEPAQVSVQAVTHADTTAPRPSVWTLLQNKPFLTITAAAALNDFGSYAFIGWQTTFYERVYHLGVTQYAPILATVLPLGGIIGGVGGGLLADRLSKSGQRAWVTVATSVAAAPLIWASLVADTPEQSFMYLGIGFALSEGWRAPAAVMCRSVVPPEISSTAISLYLCLRNVLGGLGPLLIAYLMGVWDLRTALQLVPPCYLLCAILFWSAEQQIAAQSTTPTPPATPGATAAAPAPAPAPSHSTVQSNGVHKHTAAPTDQSLMVTLPVVAEAKPHY